MSNGDTQAPIKGRYVPPHRRNEGGDSKPAPSGGQNQGYNNNNRSNYNNNRGGGYGQGGDRYGNSGMYIFICMNEINIKLSI